MKLARILAVFFVAACSGMGAFAQSWPAKPVRMIAPFAPGGIVDAITRIVAPKLSEAWGQSVVVENIVGGGGAVGTELVAKSSPDGYTLLSTSNSQVISAALRRNLPYDPLNDFVPIAPLIRQSYVLAVGAPAGVKTIPELVAAAKARPGELTFTSSGIGSGTHLMGEKFNLDAGVKMGHVPMSGGADTYDALIAGRVTYWFTPITSALPHVREGRLIALGVSGARRIGVIPEVPTIAEAGLAGFESTLWFGIWAPAGTPTAVVERIAKDISQALAAPDVREQLAKLSAEAMVMTPAEFGRFVRSEAESVARTVKAAGVKPQ